jgi:hypothetical protein
MPSPIVVEFLVRGVRDVERALRTVVQASEQADKARLRTATKSARERLHLEERLAADVGRLIGRRVRVGEHAGQREVKVAEMSARNRLRVEERFANDAAKLADRRTRNAEQAASRRTRVEEQAAKQSVRISEQAAKQSARVDEAARKATKPRAQSAASVLAGGMAGTHPATTPKETVEKKLARLNSEVKLSPKEQVRAQLASDKEIAKIRDRAANDVAKKAATRANDEKKADKEIQRSAEQTARAKERARTRENDKIVKDVERIVAKEDRAKARDVRKKEAEGESRRESVARGLGGAVKNTVGHIAGAAGKVAGVVAQLGGGFSISDSITHEASMRKQAATLSASTLMAEEGEISTKDILAKAKDVGTAQNIDPSKVMEGFDAIKKLSGKLGIAMEAMPDIAKISTATGSDIGQMSDLAGNVVAMNPTISKDALVQQMRVLSKQGIVGGVEVGDMAKYGARLTAGASQFGTNEATGVTSESNTAVMGAMAQMSRQYGGAASAAEAAMGSQRFSSDIIKHADDLKAQGIDVRDGKGTLKSAQEVILEMLKKTGGDVTKMSELGLGERGVKPLAGAAAIYRNAGGGEAGEKAVNKEFKKYTGGVSPEQIEAANKRVLAEQTAEIEMRKLSLTIGQDLLPIIAQLTPQIKNLAPVFVDLLRTAAPPLVDLIKSVGDFIKANDWIISSLAAHPIGAIMAVEVGKSIVDAGIGKMINGLISSQFGQGALVIAAATIAIQQGMIAIDKEYKKEDDVKNQSNTDQAEAGRLAARIRMGTATDEEKKSAAGLVTKLEGDRKATETIHDNPAFFKKTSGALASLTEDGRQAAKDEESQYQRAMNDLAKTMRDLQGAVEKAAVVKPGEGTGTRHVDDASERPRPATATTGMVQRNSSQ